MELSEKVGLLIDDIAAMRTTVRIQLASIGLEKCDQARDIKEAIDKLTLKHYDLIVCDYNLGKGADGQQFLELVRRKQLLPMSTAFLMITGETGYQQVSTAAEYSPDDYLLKPFTAETLGTRLVRIIEKKEALKPIYQHMGAKTDHAKALAACEDLLAKKTRYALEVMRIKGDLLLSKGRASEALALYDEILRERSTPWAEVGKALALIAYGNPDEARILLEQTLVAYPNYLAAYDSLANLLVKTDKMAAQQVVEQALHVAMTTQRQRDLGALAIGNKDFSRAEEAYRYAVDRDRTGFFKSHDDYAALARSCFEQDKIPEALNAVKDMGQHFQRTPELAARQAAVECQVHIRAGDEKSAKAALAKAQAAQKSGNLEVNTLLEIAQACFAAGDPDEAKKIIQAVAEDNQENEQIIDAARGVFEAAGLDEEGAEFLDNTRKNMIRLNNDAVTLAKSGELDKAIMMLVEAADRLPNNAQVAINAAQALLMRVQQQGVDMTQLGQAHRYITQAYRANPQHPKLEGAVAYYRKVAPPGARQLEV
ncbi:MAG: tetratricopeptide repeat protein [Proteobacteria bacterium]|nr:tetratricopeptide repeat protein [Pseudomonadota bacterium]